MLMTDCEFLHNQDLETQIHGLEQILLRSDVVREVLARSPSLQMPDWYLGAGCLAQTVWNAQHGFDLTDHLKDCDLVYYDSSDTSYQAEDRYIQRARELFADVRVPVEIVNQARVHLWYEERFGCPIEPFPSIEEAINSWPTTATSVAVKYDENAKFIVYAPYGLNDLFGMVVRANRTQVTREIYLQKAERWQKVWPSLRVMPWEA